VEGGHELRLLDQPVLEDEEPEQQVAVGVGGLVSVLRSGEVWPCDRRVTPEAGTTGPIPPG
jgi:hypothetical protein